MSINISGKEKINNKERMIEEIIKLLELSDDLKIEQELDYFSFLCRSKCTVTFSVIRNLQEPKDTKESPRNVTPKIIALEDKSVL